MSLQKGNKGAEIIKLQKALNSYNLKKYGKGKFIPLVADGDFGNNTYKAVIKFQKENNLKPDGVVGKLTWKSLNKFLEKITTDNEIVVPSGDPKHPYKNIVIEGSTFPGDPYNYNIKISLNETMKKEYLPALEEALPNAPKGLKELLTIMAHKEGFKKGTRSYINNNPGNIGNTDSGANRKLASLKDGILLQKDFIEKIITGKNRNFPLNKVKEITPYYSKEIANNPRTYNNKSPYLPGYRFVFTGQLDQFIKIYSTGARSGNSYINTIISWFKLKGIEITPGSKIQDIIKMK